MASAAASVTTRAHRIQEILRTSLKCTVVNVHDDSEKHASHAPMQGNTHTETHLRLDVVTDEFTGKTPIQRHRMVNELLKPEFEKGLHALQIKTKTTEEWASMQEKTA